jgi:hypothetical protein
VEKMKKLIVKDRKLAKKLEDRLIKKGLGGSPLRRRGELSPPQKGAGSYRD